MAKKRKKGKEKDVPIIVFTPEAAHSQQTEPLAKIEGFVTAEPGWKAVFAACVTCETPASSLPVIFWTFVRWDTGVTDVCGLVHGYDGFFFIPSQEHTFIGYVAPGTEPEELIARYFDTAEE